MVDMSRTHSIASISDVSLILNETVSLVASMRKQARWSTSSVAAILGGAVEANYSDAGDLASRWGLRGSRNASTETPLLAGFSKLRQDLLAVKVLTDFDTAALLKPFLAVIRSSTTTGSITSLALNSISKFFSYRLINCDSRNLGEAMKALSSAVTHCRFEASDSGQQDEVVLLRILNLMQEMISGVGGDLLSDESVCEMMETGLSMCCQMRLSEMLRRSAEMTMSRMVQVVFLHLGELDPAEDELQESKTHTPLSSPTTIATPKKGLDPSDLPDLDEVPKNSSETTTNETSEAKIAPYGITSIKELLRVLISILNPTQKQHTDSMRIMALRIIEVAFEVGGSDIANRASLRNLATDDLCRYLFQLVRSDNHIVLQSSLRVVGTLLHTMRIHLKLQQELFLNYVVACLVPRPEALRESGIDPSVYEALPVAPRVQQLTSGRSTPIPVRDRQRLGLEGGGRGADAREVMIECIGSLVRIPTFMIDLFVNYDCNENLSDLCEDVLGFLCRNAFPDAAIWSTTNVPPLCLDALLGYISLLHARLASNARTDLPDMPDPASLYEARRKKELVVKSAAKFNEDPKQGLIFMQENEVIDTSNEVPSFAKFLFSTSRINKRLLGDYISRPKNLPLLQEFIKLFDFRNKRLDEALRELLQKFRLPGEAQQIARIVEEFASVYYSSGTTDVASADAGYILAYAIIMLNTDQHNPQAKKSKMTAGDFARNLRGTNDNKDFEAAYLQDIYNDIKNNEIIMPEEHDTSASFDYAWKELLIRVKTAGSLKICETNVYDEAMFRSTWKPIVATLTFVFQSATDDAVFSRVLGGLTQCANIATHYGLNEVLDQIIAGLAKMTLLTADQLPGIESNTIVEVDKQRVTVSELGIAFGREFKAQLAMVLLFRICNGNEKHIQNGWQEIFDIFSALLVNSMLPSGFSPLHRYMKISLIPLPPPSRSSKSVQRNQESSLFNALSSYLSSYASDEPAAPTAEEIESTMCTFDCISSCHLDVMAANLLKLDVDDAASLVDHLLQFVENPPSRTAVGITLGQNSPADQPQLLYDPSMLLKLEVATALALVDPLRTKRYGRPVYERLLNIIKGCDKHHHLMIERALAYALRLCQDILENGVDTQENILQILNSLPENIIRVNAVPIAYGLLGCMRIEPALQLFSNTLETFTLLQKLQAHPDAAPLLFEMISLLTTSITEENFSVLITALAEFAKAGSCGAQDERAALVVKRQSQDHKARNGQAAPKASVSHKEIVQRACRSVEIMYQLRVETQAIGAKASDPEQYWSALLNALQSQCTNPCKEVAKYAFSHLQRLLLNMDLSSDNPAPTTVFDGTILPLLNDLQTSTDGKKSRSSEDSVVQAASLLCKVFLHHLSSIQERDDATELWLRILTALINILSRDSSSYLAEAIIELIKNVLLVMNSTRMLEPGNEIFEKTKRRLDEAKIGVMNDLFTVGQVEPKQTSPEPVAPVEDDSGLAPSA